VSYYVYILSNKSRTLYVGVTNELERRLEEHRAGLSAFTAKYHIHTLVYYESFNDVTDAIAWEKKIKGWLRAKKVALIEQRNPAWADLSLLWKDGAEVDSSVKTDEG
jgi:putative endonuclease